VALWRKVIDVASEQWAEASATAAPPSGRPT